MKLSRTSKLWGLGAVLAGLCWSAAGLSDAPNQIDYAMYFHADVRDAEECAMTVRDGKFVFPPMVTNPAMTCPDMFSWKLFMESIKDTFWTDWADETQNWPPKPYPLCGKESKPGTCCEPGSSNNPAGHCPVFPGDRKRLKAAAEAEKPRIGLPSVMHRFNDLSLKERVKQLGAQRSAKVDADAAQCTDRQLDSVIPKQYESIGRVIRQTNAEVTTRNRPFHYFLFRNNLYNANGVADVFNSNSKNIPNNSPYHLKNVNAKTQAGSGTLSKIDLPPDAIMIKANWLSEKLAKKLGIQDDPKHPFIKQRLSTSINPKGGGKCLLTGTHYLVAFHVSSKDIPEWVWTTFEHVNLPGRCDVTGCNDSYGYASSDKLPAGVADNYVRPHEQSDDLNDPSQVFDRDKPYTPEKIRPGLDAALKAMGIGTTASRDPREPMATDLGWRSYRLKGSQVGFTDTMGRATILGNSVTEAGFMDGSSCITCHARAGIHVQANADISTLGDGDFTFFKLGVFENSLSDYGYGRSAHGIPNKNWFHDSAQPPSLNVLQTDFVWGFLFAKPLVTKK